MAYHCRNKGRKVQGKFGVLRQFKKSRESRIPQLNSYNKFNVLATEINANILKSEGSQEVRKIERKTLREVTVKIRLERIDTQEGIIVKTLLDNRATGLVISLEFSKKQDFKLKKLEGLMNVRNVNRSFNKEEPIENTVKVNIYY